MYRKYHARLLTLAIGAAMACAVVLVASPAVIAADCGGIETALIDCTSANDTTGSPVVAILVVGIQILTALIGVVAIGAFIYAGILYSSASGNASQVAKAKEIMLNTVIGLVLFAAMGLLLNYLIPGGLFSGNAKFGAGGNGESAQYQGGNGLSTNTSSSNNTKNDTSSIKSTSPYQIVAGSWNTYVNNPNNIGTIVKSLLSTADVVGLQEVHHADRRSNIKSIASSTTGVYMAPTPSSGDKHMASYPIVYNKTKLDFISGGFKRTGSTPGLSDRYIVWVRLRIKTTGQEFYFANTHTPPSIESGGNPRNNSLAKAYQKQIAVVKSQINNLSSAGLPVFLVGDFNVNYRNDECKVSWFPCKAMHDAGMKSSFEITRLAGFSKSQGSHGDGNRLIDYVFIKNDSRVTVKSASIIGGSGNGYRGSDHKPSTAKIIITSIRK